MSELYVVFTVLQDPKVLSLGYVAVGKLVHRFPHLVSTNMALVQIFFNIMSNVSTLSVGTFVLTNVW